MLPQLDEWLNFHFYMINAPTYTKKPPRANDWVDAIYRHSPTTPNPRNHVREGCGASYFLLSRRCLVTCIPIETMVHTQMSIRPPLTT
ncbi:MAG: hypothetical protein JWL81_1804 [Verrucomicrobiales bacterium]|nr:hypothetical protein [Verrucomicrobiales bacterium]